MYAYSNTYFYYCFADYDGSSTIWAEITNTGNVSATQILNGTSSIAIASPGSNATVGINGTSNVAVFSSSGANVTGYLTTTGNVTGGNLRTAGQVSATGNVTGAYFIGNGSLLTGLPATYGNANVAAYLPTYTGTLSPLALYTDGYYYANGTPVSFSGGGGTYGNTQVAAYLPTYTGNLGGTLTTASQPYITTIGTLSGLTVSGLGAITLSPVANNITISTTFGGTVSITPDGISAINNMIIGNNTPQSGSFTTVSATGNVTASYILGDGSYITNLPVGNYSNTNVASYLTTYTGNLAAGNISVVGTTTSSVIGNVSGVVSGQLYGLVNGVNPTYGTWDFGYIAANTYTNPLQWIFAQTSLGNIDMGTITAPASYAIDIGTIF
jgi:hypothetical protein